MLGSGWQSSGHGGRTLALRWTPRHDRSTGSGGPAVIFGWWHRAGYE